MTVTSIASPLWWDTFRLGIQGSSSGEIVEAISVFWFPWDVYLKQPLVLVSTWRSCRCIFLLYQKLWYQGIFPMTVHNSQWISVKAGKEKIGSWSQSMRRRAGLKKSDTQAKEFSNGIMRDRSFKTIA